MQDRETTFLLARPERRLLRAIAARLPSWVRPDHLTVLALAAAVAFAVAAATWHFWMAAALLGCFRTTSGSIMRAMENVSELVDLGPYFLRKPSTSRWSPLMAVIDSMAVAGLLTELEERLGILIDDHEVNADMLETYGALLTFARAKALQ